MTMNFGQFLWVTVHMKEEYENVKIWSNMIKYTSRNWELCGDFKMLAFLLDLINKEGVRSIHAFSAYGKAELMISITHESSGHSEKN